MNFYILYRGSSFMRNYNIKYVLFKFFKFISEFSSFDFIIDQFAWKNRTEVIFFIKAL